MTDEQHRRASGAVAVAAAGVMALAEGFYSGLALLAGSGLALVLIWFADGLAGFVGSVGLRHISRPSPPSFVRSIGWVLLAAFFVASLSALFAASR